MDAATTRQMKLPGPDHPIVIEAETRHMHVRFEGHVIVDSRRAINLREAGYKPVLYFPRDDAAMAYFTRTDRVTFCPYKGEAHYFTLGMDGHLADNAVWTYETPFEAMSAIKDYVAFYPSQVEIYAVEDGQHPPSTDDIIRHTDSGSGRSQAEHWAANVTGPAAD